MRNDNMRLWNHQTKHCAAHYKSRIKPVPSGHHLALWCSVKCFVAKIYNWTRLKMALFTDTSSSSFPFNNIFTLNGRRAKRNTAVSSYYSQHKITRNEMMFMMLQMNKESFQPNFSCINDSSMNCIQPLNTCVVFVLDVMSV